MVLPSGRRTQLAHIPIDPALQARAGSCELNLFFHAGQVDMLDPREFGAEAIARNGRDAFYSDQIGAAPRAQEMLADARFAHGPYAVRDWSYRKCSSGSPWLIVGAEST